MGAAEEVDPTTLHAFIFVLKLLVKLAGAADAPTSDSPAGGLVNATAEDALTDLLVRAVRIEERVGRIRAWGDAAEGRVRAQVDASGTLTELHIADDLEGFSMTELADLVTRAQTAACERVRADIDELQRELVEDPYATAVLRETKRKHGGGGPTDPHEWQNEWDRARWAP